MSGVLVIGESERAEIKAAVQRARANPVPWEAMQAIALGDDRSTLPLAERPEATSDVRRKYPSQHLMLGTYHAAISFEEQPAGLMRHLSISSRLPGRLPGPEVMTMVCEAFGFSTIVCGSFMGGLTLIDHPARVWLEEFERGHEAVNIIELVPS